jgi:ketosteroid isomerase-like protein
MPEPDEIQLVQKVFDAFMRRDAKAMAELCHPEMEFYPQGTAMLARASAPYRGRTGITEYLDDVEKTWIELRVVPRHYEVLGNRVLVRGRVYARGADGLLIDSTALWVWEVRDGLLVWGCGYADEAEALETFRPDRPAAEGA